MVSQNEKEWRLAWKKKPGTKGRRTKEQKEKLKNTIESIPQKYCYNNDILKSKRMSEVILKTHSVNYNTHIEYAKNLNEEFPDF